MAPQDRGASPRGVRAVLVGTHVQPLLWDTRVGRVGWRAGELVHVREAWFPGGDRKRAPSRGKVLQFLLLLPGLWTGCWGRGQRGSGPRGRGVWGVVQTWPWVPLHGCAFAEWGSVWLSPVGAGGCGEARRGLGGQCSCGAGPGREDCSPGTVSWRAGGEWLGSDKLETSPRGCSPATCAHSISMNHVSSSPPSRVAVLLGVSCVGL